MKIWLSIVVLLFGAGIVAAVAATSPVAVPAAGAGSPVFVELFTSQGCSSCPPADALVQRLDREAGIVAVSRPVTYWDRLGWKDTLAQPANDRLQQRYAARRLPGAGVYTPETIVQGAAATVGSDERDLRRLIAAARRTPAITLTQSGSDVVVSRAVANSELRFLAVKSRANVDVASGENGRRRLGYTNVVLGEAAVACDAAKPCRAAIPAAISGQRGADRWAAVLQDRGGGTVRAVRWIGRPAK